MVKREMLIQMKHDGVLIKDIMHLALSTSGSIKEVILLNWIALNIKNNLHLSVHWVDSRKVKHIGI